VRKIYRVLLVAVRSYSEEENTYIQKKFNKVLFKKQSRYLIATPLIHYSISYLSIIVILSLLMLFQIWGNNVAVTSICFIISCSLNNNNELISVA
jgi:hypothetical protein